MVCVNIFALCYLLQIILYSSTFDIVLPVPHRVFTKINIEITAGITVRTGTNTIENESYRSFVFVYYCNNNLNQLVTGITRICLQSFHYRIQIQS